MTNCEFYGNTAQAGGAICNWYGSATVTNCLFVENIANAGGAIASIGIGTPTVEHCTFGSNTADSVGGGIYNWEASAAINDCILWDNVPSAIYIDSGVALVSHSDVEGGWPGEGNIDADPLFMAGPGGCYYLSQTTAGQPWDSPCVDAGSDTAANLGLDALTTRRDEVGDAGTVDMGYHYPTTGQPFIHGDYDYDADVDLDDWAELGACLTGPCGVSPCPAPLYSDACCSIGDFDDDGDVDLLDFAEFQQAFGQ